MSGFVGANTTKLSSGGKGLQDCGKTVKDLATDLEGDSRACASAAHQELADALRCYSAAIHEFSKKLGVHVDTVGWLAANVSADIDSATGGDPFDPYGVSP